MSSIFQQLAALCRTRAVSTSSRARRDGFSRVRPQVENLEERALPTHLITPVAGINLVGANPGNTVEFRKGPEGFIQFHAENYDDISGAIALFSLPRSDRNVIADATDNGVAVINYLDSAVGNDFPNPRDVGIGPLTPLKTTGPAGGPNSGTFNPRAEDDEFAMVASGFIYIPSAGPWTFVVKSDDGNRLTMGTNNAVVTEFNGGRPPAYGNNLEGNPGQPGVTDSVAIVPRAGFYPYHLLYWQGNGGAMVQFTAVKGSQPEGTDFEQGVLPQGSRLVGDTAHGGLAVFQNLATVPITHHGRRNG